MIAIDGTHLASLPLCLLLAGVRAADGSYDLLGFGLVRTEDADNWQWLMRALVKSLWTLTASKVAFISDRQKGLQSSLFRDYITEKAPKWLHLYCAKHILSNVKQMCGIHGKGTHEMDTHLWNMVKTRRKEKSVAALDRIRDLVPDAAGYLGDIPPRAFRYAWSLDYARDCYSTSNIVEALNGADDIMKIRTLESPLELVTALDYYMQKKRRNNQLFHETTGAQASCKFSDHSDFTKLAAETLDFVREKAGKLKVTKQVEGTAKDAWVVVNQDGVVDTVESVVTITYEYSSPGKEALSDENTDEEEVVIMQDDGGDENEEAGVAEAAAGGEEGGAAEGANDQTAEGGVVGGEGENMSDDEAEVTVIKTVHCTCDFETRLDHCPCPCIVAVCLEDDLAYTILLPEYHLKSSSVLAYSAPFFPVCADQLRATPLTRGRILPPPQKKRVGRKRVRRMKPGTGSQKGRKKNKQSANAVKKSTAERIFEEAVNSFSGGFSAEPMDTSTVFTSRDSDVEEVVRRSDAAMSSKGDRDVNDRGGVEEGEGGATSDPRDEDDYITIELEEAVRQAQDNSLILMTTTQRLEPKYERILESHDQLEDPLIIAASIMLVNYRPGLHCIPDPVPAHSPEREAGFTAPRVVGTEVTLPAVRFIHLPGHWVVAWRMSEDQPIYYCDSLNPEMPPAPAVDELTLMFAVGDEEIQCVNMDVQQQRGYKVCGVRAILAALLAMGNKTPEQISGINYPNNGHLYEVRW